MSCVFVDSSVWIDHLRGIETRQTAQLDELLAQRDVPRAVAPIVPIVLGDLVLLEVLRGIGDQKAYMHTRTALLSFPRVHLGGTASALAACDHYRRLRQLGITVRKSVDCLIAAWCIAHDVALLHADRDFAPFETHCGLRAFGTEPH